MMVSCRQQSSQRLVAAVVIAVAVAMVAMAPHGALGQNSPQDYVRLHNSARSAVGVGPVAWDATVAQYAQSYAEKRKGDCALQHSGSKQYGENIYWGSAGKAWSAADAVASWVAEKQRYHYDSNSCDPQEKSRCLHYTQVVWRKSTKIGCARVDCTGNRGVFITCNYEPKGNVQGQKPY